MLASATGKQAGISENPGSRTTDGGQSWTTCLAVMGPSVQLVTNQTKHKHKQVSKPAAMSEALTHTVPASVITLVMVAASPMRLFLKL